MLKRLALVLLALSLATAALAQSKPPPLPPDGYKLMGIRDFLLDGNQLAQEHTKIALQGTYDRLGRVDLLYASSKDVVMEQQLGAAQRNVPLLIDNASRNARAALLHCQQDDPYMQAGGGCRWPLQVKGQVTICTLTNTFGVPHQEPCLDVEDVW